MRVRAHDIGTMLALSASGFQREPWVPGPLTDERKEGVNDEDFKAKTTRGSCGSWPNLGTMDGGNVLRCTQVKKIGRVTTI